MPKAGDRRKDVLLAPSAAFRVNGAATRRGGSATLWQPGPDGQLQAVKVKTGMTDGVVTELVETNLKEGDRVATATAQAADSKKKQNTGAFPGASPAPRGKRF